VLVNDPAVSQRRLGGAMSARSAPGSATTGDAALVRAAAAGDRFAFGQLYERFASAVHGILLAHASPGDVDDLLQDVFVTAMERLPSLRDPAAFPGWLMMIARNQTRMHHRSRFRLVPLTEDVAQAHEVEADAHAVLGAIRSLPEAYREPLMLRLVEGLSGNEIAERTGLTGGSVRVNLHRGMKLLREKLGGSDA
jgi:RNA polymerase sigma-70 factor (ECF subfamily)